MFKVDFFMFRTEDIRVWAYSAVILKKEALLQWSGFQAEEVGNTSDEVKSQANATTDSYKDNGSAKAIERFILGQER